MKVKVKVHTHTHTHTHTHKIPFDSFTLRGEMLKLVSLFLVFRNSDVSCCSTNKSSFFWLVKLTRINWSNDKYKLNNLDRKWVQRSRPLLTPLSRAIVELWRRCGQTTHRKGLRKIRVIVLKFNVFLLPSLPCLLPPFSLLPLLLVRWVACLPARLLSFRVCLLLFFLAFHLLAYFFFRLFFFMENVQKRSS